MDGLELDALACATEIMRQPRPFDLTASGGLGLEQKPRSSLQLSKIRRTSPSGSFSMRQRLSNTMVWHLSASLGVQARPG